MKICPKRRVVIAIQKAASSPLSHDGGGLVLL